MTTSARRRGGAAISALATALAAALLWAAVAASPAGAQAEDAAAALGLEVQAGYGGGAGSPWVPIEVSIHPTRLVAGVLVAETRTEGGVVREERPIEVSAASRKFFRFLVPSGAISVQLHEPRRDPVSVNVRRGGDEGRFLVGVLGEASGDLPGVRHEAADMTGQWASVDPAWAELSPLALQPLGTLVAGLDQLAQLSPQGQRNIAAAVVSGTDIVVVIDRPGAIDLAAAGLPWQPAVLAVEADGYLALSPQPDAWTVHEGDLTEAAEGSETGDGGDVVAAAVPAGRGRVTVVGAAPGQAGLGRSTPLWSELVGPSAAMLGRHSEQAVDRHPFLAARLVQEAGAGVPKLPWLAAFIIVYVLVAGPVNGLVLARLRRPELAWVTVPAVTVVFTLGAFAGAVGGQKASHLAGSVAYWVDDVGAEAVVANVRAPRPGAHQIRMAGSGWTVRPLRTGAQPSVVRTAGEHITVDLELESLQPGVVIGWRALDAAPPMRVEPIIGAEGLRVRIVNTSGRALEHVGLRAATSTVRVGTLAPGEEHIVDLADARLRRVEPWMDPFHDLPAGPDGVPEAPRSLEALLRTEVMDGNPGIIWAVAVAGRGAADAVQVDGRAPVDKGSLVAVGAHPAFEQGALAPRQSVSRDLLVARGNAMRFQLAVEAREAQLRFRVPPGERDAMLAHELDAENWGGVVSLEVWSAHERTWLPLKEAFHAGGVGDPELLLTPLGELYVRATGDLWPFEYSSHSIYEVPSAGSAASSDEEQA